MLSKLLRLKRWQADFIRQQFRGMMQEAWITTEGNGASGSFRIAQRFAGQQICVLTDVTWEK